MATYRNSYANYYSDKTGNHSPVGSILPVFADINLAANGPEYTYPQHLYCNGQTLKIRDYPELYSIIQNTYGGSPSVNVTQTNQPGGLRRSFILNNKLFMNFYWDSSNNKVNVKRPYPYGAVFRFNNLITNPYGGFPSNGIFNQETFYQLTQPTEDVVGIGDFTNEFTYEIILPDTVDLSTLTNTEKLDYLKRFGGSTSQFWGGAGPIATHPDIFIQKSFTLSDFPYNIGTFALPDYRQNKILGFGTVNGAGTATPENAINNFVGQTGGQWYIPKNTLIDGGEFFVIGDVKSTGYNSITADIPSYLTGSVKYKVGPMDDYVFPFPPTHSHRILSVEVDETKQVELSGTPTDKFAVTYINSRANINLFEPNGSAGGALGHSHGLIGVPLQNSLTATYGNTNGIGETLGTAGGQQYQYMVSESATIAVLSVTYDSASGFITVNTDGNHNLSIGDIVTVSNATPTEFTGNFTIVSDGFSLTNFKVLPRDGETPGQATAGGTSINVKLANGYFAETEIIEPPRIYVVDINTAVGGKEQTFEIPGNTTTIQEDTFTGTAGTTVLKPSPSQGTIAGCYITIKAPGGGGADSDNDATNGGYAQIGLTVDGNFYTIKVTGGTGGTSGSAGGAGGVGGTIEVPQVLLDDSRFNIGWVDGQDGQNGGMQGLGGNDVLGGGMYGSPVLPQGANTTGGVGTAQTKSISVSNPVVTYTDNGSWPVPEQVENETSRTIAIEMSGGGGGSGNGNANSNCTGFWPLWNGTSGWPKTIDGREGGLGGLGGRGERISGTISAAGGTLNWELGNGGNVGYNRRSGTSGAGTVGLDPATGNPWGPPWPGGVGTGNEPGIPPGVSGATGTLSGAGGYGAWGNGATGGSGGSVTGLFYNGILIAGAGGGGGGGGSGGGNNGGSTTDGCYDGANAVGPPSSLLTINGPIDFATGASGSGGSCSAGGGGGGGAACGVINVTNGGTGGTAGSGHGGNGGGSGGGAGTSAVRGGYWNSVVLDSNGALPTDKGYVKISYAYTQDYWDIVGGAGGQGANATISFGAGIETDVVVSLQAPGQGGGLGTDGGSGEVYVRYFAQESGTTVPGGTSSPTGTYYEGDADGNPIGAPQSGNVWLSSTDPGIKERAFGQGTGNNLGFSGSSSSIPNNTANKILQYIAFTGSASDASGKRQLEVGTFDLRDCNTIGFTIIRGSGQNGGEAPSQALNLFYKKGASSNTTLFSQILLAADTNPAWQRVDLSIPEGDAMRAIDVTLVLEQDRGPTYQSAAATDDNYGLGAISFFYDSSVQQTFISTGGATLAGNIDDGGLPLDGSLDTGIDEVRREVTAQQAGIVTTDGTFTMSSSTPITTSAIVTAENNIPLITKYHRVKYLIKAL